MLKLVLAGLIDLPDRRRVVLWASLPSDLTAAAPDLVLLGTEPLPFSEKHIPELATATALPPDRFRIADGEYLSWHGSRTPVGIDYAAGLIEDARARPTS